MKQFYSAIILMVSLNLSAQQWCAPGAQWHHDYSDVFGSIGYVETHYSGDTTISGLACQIIKYTTYAHNIPGNSNYIDGPYEFITSVTDEVVYIWTGTGMDTLINYAAQPGDHWQLSIGDHTVLVTDTGYAMIDDQSLKYLTVDVITQEIIVLSDTIFERIGPLQVYLNMSISEPFVVEYGLGELRCYSDNEMSYSRIDGPCEIALGIHSRSNTLGIEVFPNPASHQVCIGNLKKAYSFELIDQTGSIVLRSDLTGTGSNCFPVSGLATGSYLLRVICKDHVHQEKVIIEN